MWGFSLAQKLGAEALGSFFLFATVVGSGIMAETLAGGNVAIALLGNTLATGAILFVLIAILAPISGAHFNPAVTLVMFLRKQLPISAAVLFVMAQLAGGLIGVWSAHVMFDMPVVQFSEKVRTGNGQWLGELIATFGLIFTILGTVRFRPEWVAPAVGLYISAGYWFTSSTSFANPAITVGRAFSNSFAGIAPEHVAGFVIAQFAGAILAWALAIWLFEPKTSATQSSVAK
ncbi:Glycerol uptake facilitator (Major Intrinsic Protein Family) [Parasphingorhabdus marina DSM 22363]|uniref:Glycerol uptake facilitator (Major Intrinsic Protein Family) n=1 Tax=Parasphingorhabdus marina DSM 22363 TaxID=1123272 RepID=A0A1N6ESY3_9SPHN|nr:MIP/aquaporin family protein [Parasphingorhabdus marina]SIN86061.1 Glycerol uptake facilitator (Major Intrinsic Protein Family) [Parasphingorhabdus marina DSM 22363]